MTYDDLETFNMHGLVLRTTREQFCRIRSRLVRLPAFLRWHKLDTLARMHHVCSDTPEVFAQQSRAAWSIAEELAEADRDVTLALVELIEQETRG